MLAPLWLIKTCFRWFTHFPTQLHPHPWVGCLLSSLPLSSVSHSTALLFEIAWCRLPVLWKWPSKDNFMSESGLYHLILYSSDRSYYRATPDTSKVIKWVLTVCLWRTRCRCWWQIEKSQVPGVIIGGRVFFFLFPRLLSSASLRLRTVLVLVSHLFTCSFTQFVNLIQTYVIWQEGTSAEKMPLPD